MQILINTDHNIKGSHEFLVETAKLEKIVADALRHFQKNITRIEVHLTDVNAGKTGFLDKRCLIEARVSGVQRIIARHQANNLREALDGAVLKLKNSLNHTFGKLKRHNTTVL